MSFKVLPAQPRVGFSGSPAQGMGLSSWEHTQGSPSMAQAKAGPCQGSPARTSGGFILPHLQGHPSSHPIIALAVKTLIFYLSWKFFLCCCHQWTLSYKGSRRMVAEATLRVNHEAFGDKKTILAPCISL